jgi:hypothetical protein
MFHFIEKHLLFVKYSLRKFCLKKKLFKVIFLTAELYKTGVPYCLGKLLRMKPQKMRQTSEVRKICRKDFLTRILQ